MKNKTSTYLLIIIVLGLWGVLIYKFVNDFSDDPIFTAQLESSNFKAPVYSKKEKIELLPLQKDPFLGTPYRSKEKISKRPLALKTVEWPQIKYKGLVKGEKNSSFVLQINGNDHILSEGEELNGITLIRGNSIKATLSYKGVYKEFEL